VAGFQHRYEAERFLAELRDRFAHFGLQLHVDKTRIVEFGCFAEQNRRQRREGKPETFNFLGFTHICGRTRKGHFTVLRQTMRQRQQAKLRALKEELRRRMHTPIGEQGAYLRAVLTGHFRYYGVPMNGPALSSFHGAVGRLWWRSLRRRSQKSLPWAPPAAIHPTLVPLGPYLSSLSATAPMRCHPRWEPDALVAPVRICGGGREQCDDALVAGGSGPDGGAIRP
jgi:RNA-directed DNA polymerase